MDEELIDLGDLRGYKRIVLRLRWATLVVTSFIDTKERFERKVEKEWERPFG